MKAEDGRRIGWVNGSRKENEMINGLKTRNFGGADYYR